MALLHNTVIQSAMLGRRMAGTEPILPLTGLVRMEKRNFLTGEHTPAKTDGYLVGMRHPQTWFMAMVTGGSMSSRYSAAMSFSPTATGQSIFNLTGSTSMLMDASALFLEATFPGNGTATMSFTTTATAGGIGQMTGTTIDSGAITNASIAAAVLAAAQGTPISANIKQVNDTTVNGTGAPGNEWGP